MDGSSSAPKFHLDTGQCLPNLSIACHPRKMAFCVFSWGKEGCFFQKCSAWSHQGWGGVCETHTCGYQRTRGQGLEGFVWSWCRGRVVFAPARHVLGSSRNPRFRRVSLVTAEQCPLARECHHLVTSGSVPHMLSTSTHFTVVCGDVGSVSPGHLIFYWIFT